MKQKVAELLSRNVIADITVMGCVQGCCFLTATLVCGLGIWSLAHLDLTVVEIFLGIAWTTGFPLLLVGAGFLLPILAKARNDELS